MTESEMTAKLNNYLNNQPFGAIITRKEMPELMEFAPCCGEVVTIGTFKVARRVVDQLDQFTVSKPYTEKPKVYCPKCGTRIFPEDNYTGDNCPVCHN